MTQGMFSAVSGIRANQTKLNVISNNIANVNTLGFKSSSANFATVFANTINGGTAPNGTLGGTNPRQMGNGTLVSEIASNFSQGGTQFTGRNTDLMVNGEGFFAVQRVDINSGNNSTDFYLTRAGNFTLDSAGNLVTSSGDRLYGTSQVSGTSTATLGKVQIPTEFQVTKDLDVNNNILGTHFSPVGTSTAALGPIDAAKTAGTISQNTVTVQLQSFTIGSDGAISAKYSNGDIITVRTNQADVTANPSDPTQWHREIVHRPYEGGSFAASNVTATDNGAVDQVGATAVFDGGKGLAIAGAGMEGMQLQLQMASVTNPAGLLYDGNNNFLTGANSGQTQFGVAGTGSRGSLNAGSLESSNVDLAGEFTSMIIAQRGLEAASKAVRTQSEVMQTIIQMV
jgi:flagellar hook protein FlgE